MMPRRIKIMLGVVMLLFVAVFAVAILRVVPDRTVPEPTPPTTTIADPLAWYKQLPPGPTACPTKVDPGLEPFYRHCF